MSTVELSSLAPAARWAVTFTTLALVVVSGRALTPHQRHDRGPVAGRGRATPFTAIWGWFAVAAAFAHLPALASLLPRLFPFGFALGIISAVASISFPSVRRAFAALTDAEIRLMLAFRAIFGALLFGLAGVGIMPPSFALAAGFGDLVVGWLALAAPSGLDAGAPRPWRLLVHGLGLLDVAQVVLMAVMVVRPWSAAHGEPTNTMTLPWVAAPLMLALNLHGFWQACGARDRELGRHGPEPARDVRSAVSRA